MSSSACRGRVLEHQRFAEDRRGFGERHRQPALQRRAVGQRHVVERVAELVRERRDRFVAAVEVHHDAADVALDAHAVRAAAFAVAHLGVDPLLVERPVCERGEIGRVTGERREHVGRWRPLQVTSPARPTGANSSHNGSPPSWPSTAALAWK